MYMFNRSNDSPSISHFIKGKIQEEEDDGNGESTNATGQAQSETNNKDSSLIKSLDFSASSNIPSAHKIKSDEDFMFDFEKGWL